MYRGFNLILDIKDELFYQKGMALTATYKLIVKRTLDNFISPDGSISGSKMQSNWFPQIDADIFISHSHIDEKIAISLAGWLHDKFGITTFIDSCIWGYSNDLLKQIDNKHCLNQSGNTYSYNKRNNSTSHVHMMLSTALIMMMDKAECLFFLNTPNSITTKEIISQTESPWIFSEISMSELIRRKKLADYRPKITETFSKGGVLVESLKIKYDVYLGHLTQIGIDNLKEWEAEWSKTPKESRYALDILYNLNTSIL